MRIKDAVNAWSIQKKLILLVMISFLPAVVIIFVTGMREREHEIELGRNRALLMAHSLAAQQEQIAAGTRQMLSTLAQLPDVQRRDAVACRRLFQDLVKQNEIYSVIVAATPDGSLLASSTPLTAGSVRISDRKYFRDALRTKDFSAGEYVMGRVSGVPVINYSYPVLDENKNIVTVVVAGFKLDKYADFISKANLEPGFAVVIADHQGVRMFRMPEHASAKPGLGVADEVKKNIFGPREQGIYERTADDGVYRIYAFKKLRLREDADPYLYILVGLPKQQLLDKANRSLVVNLTVLSGATLLVMFLVWIAGHQFFVKPIKMLLLATGRFGGGDLFARTGLPHTDDEMGQLAKSFDDMAMRMESKDRERAEMEMNLQESEERYRNIFQNNHATMLLIDPADGGIVDANPAAARYYGYTIEELRGKNISDINTLSFPEIKEEMKLAQTEQRRYFLFQHRLADGSVRPVEVYSGAMEMAGKQLLFSVVHDISKRKEAEAEREKLIGDLQEALSKIRTLSGLLPICASCKKIRNDEGYWEQIEVYIRDRSEAEFSHSICPDCKIKLYPDLFKKYS